jgi:hypothetical protein
MRYEGYVARMGEKGYVYKILLGKPEGRWPLERPRRRWVDNIKMDLRGIQWYGLDWSGSEYGPVEGSCEHGNEPSGSIKCWEVLEWLHNLQLLKKGSAPLVSERFYSEQSGLESYRVIDTLLYFEGTQDLIIVSYLL